MSELFFTQDYGKLYEKMEKGVCEVFKFSHPLGIVHHLFIKREIPFTLAGQKYYDVITPYGYGGPVIKNCKKGGKSELVRQFQQAFENYCSKQNIVSEFIRFHPILKNVEDFREFYETAYMRETTGTTLKDYEDPVASEFSKSARKAIRKALKAGVEYRVTVNPASLASFKEIYYTTMKRLNAESYYYFDDRYFDNCLKYFGDRIVLVEALFEGEVIGAELHFLCGSFMHTHLSGTVENCSHLSPVYVMTYAAAIWGKENGVDLIHAGGGVTNNPDDTLYLFKKKFGQNTNFQFHIGKKVWNPEIYRLLCEEGEVRGDEDFFPAYRAKTSKLFPQEDGILIEQ